MAVRSLASVEQLHFASTPVRRLSACPNPATGREADTVRDQLARDIAEGRAIRRDAPHQAFQEIKRTLDAGRLLATLAHSHGVIPGKYAITRGRDGGDRIQCGNRNLNVSDFLTKELNLPWAEASQLMRDTYRAQTGRNAAKVTWPAPRHAPAPTWWREFQTYRAGQAERDRAAWGGGQGRHEQARRGAIRATFDAARRTIQADSQLSRADRKAALSVARMTRVEQETALRSTIAAERETLKAVTRQPLDERYRAFLAGQAQAGNGQALTELRRIRRTEPEPNPTYAAIRQARQYEPNAIIWRGQVRSYVLTHEVQRNGDVTYRRDGAALLVDEGPSVRLWESDRDAIETALRLAQQKFGQTLTLSGSLEFRLDAARVAAEIRLNVEFDDPALNLVMHDRGHELRMHDKTQTETQRQQDRERHAAMRKLARDILRPPEPDRSGNDERSAGGNSPEIDRNQDPNIDR